MLKYEDLIDAQGDVQLAPGARYTENFLQLRSSGLITPKRWHEYGDSMIANFMGRTGLTFTARDIPAPADLGPELDAIKIASISSAISVENPLHENLGTRESWELRVQDYRDGCRLCEASNPSIGPKWVKDRLEELEVALAQKPHIVCFGELAYPPAVPRQQKDWSAESLQEFAQFRAAYEKAALELVAGQRHPPFIFLGSYHCLLTLYSVGVVYPWGNKVGPVKAVARTEPWADKEIPIVISEELLAPFLYKKRFPARRVGESTRVPAALNFDMFQTPAGKLAILICSDVLDLNQFLQVARLNILPSRGRLDLIIVPSFNESRKLASMCCELSYAARTAVVLVNANDHLASFPKSELYLCGLSAGELEKVKGLGLGIIANKHNPIHLDRGNGRRATIKIFEISREAARGFRNDLAIDWATRRRPGRRVKAANNDLRGT